MLADFFYVYAKVVPEKKIKIDIRRNEVTSTNVEGYHIVNPINCELLSPHLIKKNPEENKPNKLYLKVKDEFTRSFLLIKEGKF
jgi:hypothetical protein